MAAKPDAKESKDAAAPEKGAAAPAAEAAPAQAGGGGSLIKTLIPVLVAVVLAPAASFAVAEFVLLPRLQKKLAVPAPEHGAAPAASAEEDAAEAPAKEEGHGSKEGHGGKEGEKGGNPNAYEFNNVVVNLAGTMGTRYLKTSFIVTAREGKSIKGPFEANKAKLTDITLNVLSSLTLADLEEPGSKNVLREKLVAAYNQALGKRLVEQVYFADFVIQ